MIPYTKEERLALLQQKGGIMLFTIVRPARIYRGFIILSPLINNRRIKNLVIKEYKYAESTEA